jgi:hypothetical protein
MRAIELVSCTLLAGVAAMAAAVTLDLPPLAVALSFPLGAAVFLLMSVLGKWGAA